MTSHDAALLRRYCERAIWLDDGRIRRSGPADEVLAEYERSFDELDPTPAGAQAPVWTA